MTGDRTRGQLLTQLEVLLRRGVSVVVEGQFGSGKTESLKIAARSLESDRTIVRLRGTPRGTKTAYLALADLVRVRPGTVPHPAVMFAQLALRLRKLAVERPVILLIDNFDFLDPQSRAMCTMLLEMPSVTLLVSCNRVEDTPELRAAVNSRTMEALTLSSLSVAEGREVIERFLGGEVSTSVVNSLHAHSRGNARILTMLAAHGRENGNIAHVDGLWRTTAHYAEPFTSSSLRSGLAVLQSRLNADERAALEVLAAAGSVHIDVLARHCDMRALEHLQREGMVDARDGGNTYWLHSKGLAHILRQTLGDARSRQIWTEIVEPGMALRGVRPPGANIVWALQRGIEVNDTALLNAADDAMRAYSPRIALDLVSAVKRKTELSARVQAEAHWFLGQVEEGRRALDGQADAPEASTAPAVDDAAISQLVRSVFAADDVAWDEDPEQLTEDPLRQLLIHRRTGNYPALLYVFRANSFPSGSDARYLVTMLAAEAYAACGDSARARLMTIECGLVAGSVRSAVVRELGETAHYRVLFLNGEWRVLTDMLSQHVLRRPGRLLFGEQSTLSLPRLISRESRDGVIAGDRSAARPADLFAWFIQRSADLFALQGSGRSPATGLQELAGDRKLTGLFGLQLFALGSLVLLQGEGDTEAALADHFNELDLKRLERCARNTSGPLARQLGLLAEGLLAGDPATLVRAAQAAARHGNVGLSAVAATLASRAAGRIKQPEVQRAAQVLVPGSDSRPTMPEDTSMLTRRERQVVDLAMSRSKNSEIAAVLGISPRTAERHLQNAYRKLGVSTREQLRLVLQSPDGAAESGGA
ncbi:helix-turn-helix transcriptional regulator [Arthrobacter sp. TB 23]|uniref:helix-turn-helix transcriptional regulator n=1 Tax=Arthrobacter sp. TB 23 TaxID=494419 RepID=UPI0003724B92|nr:LuxR C-terminal-related transcriptional regulator [Arthrobacter sp. TB 23]